MAPPAHSAAVIPVKFVRGMVGSQNRQIAVEPESEEGYTQKLGRERATTNVMAWFFVL